MLKLSACTPELGGIMKMSRENDRGKLLKAIADPIRIDLLGALMKRPQYISQLAKTVDKDRSVVSYHLAVLESAGILDSHYVVLESPHSLGKAARVYSINMTVLKAAVDQLMKVRKLKLS
jgi:DNA-binding transcriptional ArsR family regulator